ncbi:MAG: GTPase HflX [Deltaproteobacteria bacterium]|nr:MAG: GTPase HflX [Deltaproteobacteria bacterium]
MLVPADECVRELARLADTAGVEVVGEAVQTVRRINPASFIGHGKVEEVRGRAEEAKADVVIFDEPLSPAQQRNLERDLNRKVIDRSALILDIFAQRARSLEGKMQVELAQLQYLLPRLTRQWTHLSRLGGGVGTRGPGETQLEVDRRRVRTRIGQLHRRLRDVERTRGLHRHERAAVPFPTVALVGYTNSGKSTLMNRLTQAGVLVEDRLFATLDPTVRRLRLPEGLTVLLADTVGFIHKLPHQLVEAFKGTLEEVREADLLLHVIDVAQSTWPEQAQVVEAVLEEIGAGDRPAIRVFNKTDLPAAGSPPPASGPDAVSISARTGKDVGALLAAIEARLTVGLERVRCALPSGRGDVLAWLRRVGRVVEEYYRDGVVMVTALVPPKVAGQLRKRLPETAAPPC